MRDSKGELIAACCPTAPFPGQLGQLIIVKLMRQRVTHVRSFLKFLFRREKTFIPSWRSSRSCQHQPPCTVRQFSQILARISVDQGFATISSSCSIPLGTKVTPWCAK